jgi:hypothetical protein
MINKINHLKTGSTGLRVRVFVREQEGLTALIISCPACHANGQGWFSFFSRKKINADYFPLYPPFFFFTVESKSDSPLERCGGPATN